MLKHSSAQPLQENFIILSPSFLILLSASVQALDETKAREDFKIITLSLCGQHIPVSLKDLLPRSLGLLCWTLII